MTQKLTSAALYFSRVARQMNVSSKVVSPVKITGLIPGGFPYSAFNGGALVRPESMMSLVETVRGNIFYPTPQSPWCALDADKLFDKYGFFISAATTQVDEILYDSNICKGPLVFDVELDHVGKTSAQLKTSFYLEGISKPLIVSRVSSVFINYKTRRPAPPPDWWAEKYKSLIGDENGTNSMGRLEFLEGDASQATECQFKIALSDCDPYRHTNWSHYLRLCHNAFGHHQVEKHGDKGYDDYFHRGVRCFSVLFKNESSVGDVLSVRTSPSNREDVDNVFYFTLENQSKSLVCQSKIEFYPLMK